MLQFNFERIGEGAPSGFDLGDIELCSGGSCISSKRNEGLRVMIYLSIVGLVDSLLMLRKRKKVEFVSVDSSFSFFLYWAGGRVCISSKGIVIGPFEFLEVLRSFEMGVVRFISDGNGLAEDDAVFHDFDGAMSDLSMTIDRG